MKSRIISSRNVNDALVDTLYALRISGIEESSRNGPVLRLPGPVIVEYAEPQERVLFSAVRDANPFFHFMEGLWMLAGRNDVEWIQHYNSRMGEFSDDKTTLWGAYGWRWRRFFDRDQLKAIIDHLKEQPTSRRAVLTMWAPNGDLWPYDDEDLHYPENDDPRNGKGGLQSRDVPCNTHAYIDLSGGVLNLTVMNRSNDAIWGAFGANAVHMSMLQEYLAMHLGVGIGTYYQISNNMHLYTERFPKEMQERLIVSCDNRYRYDHYGKHAKPLPFLCPGERPEDFDRDLHAFLTAPQSSVYFTDFFADTVMPMYWAWEHRKRGVSSGLADALEIAATDWRIACVEWLERRQKKHERCNSCAGTGRAHPDPNVAESIECPSCGGKGWVK